ncbi:MAG: hypothetical protein OSJ69_04995 [Acetatifactor sp.]|nr:hypothetical protein [Acetatifactor sp.]
MTKGLNLLYNHYIITTVKRNSTNREASQREGVVSAPGFGSMMRLEDPYAEGSEPALEFSCETGGIFSIYGESTAQTGVNGE